MAPSQLTNPWDRKWWIADAPEYAEPSPTHAPADLLYRPNPDANKQYYCQPAEPYVDNSEIFYTLYETRYREHDRWSRMIMMVEEMWECLLGVPELKELTTSASQTTSTIVINPVDCNRSSDHIIWSST